MENLDNGQRVAREVLGENKQRSLEEMLSGWLLQERIICQRFKDDCKEKEDLALNLTNRVNELKTTVDDLVEFLSASKILAGFRSRLRKLEAGLKGQTKCQVALAEQMEVIQTLLNRLIRQEKKRNQTRKLISKTLNDLL